MKKYCSRRLYSLSIGLLLTLFVSSAYGEDPSQNSTAKNGEQLYIENCLTCHQVNGGGVFMIAPPLRKTSYVLGDKERLIGIVINGFNEDVEIEGEYYSNPMPGIPHLTDEEVAKILTYVRSNFGNDADPVSEQEVAAARAKLKVED